MTDDLVKRLRDLADCAVDVAPYESMTQAADCIEQLEAALQKIVWIATPDHEEARYKAEEIARTALEKKDGKEDRG